MRGKRLSRDAALRIGAIGLVVAAAALFLPGLLSPPDPPPLPADVGLGATGASGAQGMVAKAPERERPEPPRNRSPEKREEEPEHDRAPVRASHGQPDRGKPDRAESPPPPAPAPAPSPAPATAASPAYIAPPPAPAAPPAPPPDAPGDFGP